MATGALGTSVGTGTGTLFTATDWAGATAAGFAAGAATAFGATAEVVFFVVAGATVLSGALLAEGDFLPGDATAVDAFFWGTAAFGVGTDAFFGTVVFLEAAGLAAEDVLIGVAALGLPFGCTGAAREGAGFLAGAAGRLVGATALTDVFLAAGLLTRSPRYGGPARGRVPHGDGRSRFGRRGL